jgi:hypothetical protein
MTDLGFTGLQTAMADEYHPGDSVCDFFSARTLDTTVPPH